MAVQLVKHREELDLTLDLESLYKVFDIVGGGGGGGKGVLDKSMFMFMD